MLELIAVNALCAVGLTLLLRTLVRWVAPKLLSRKPLGCNLCMSFWTSILVIVFPHLPVILSWDTVRVMLGSWAVALFVLEHVTHPELPTHLPESEP